jgi:sucrose phosphorylase
LATGAAASNLDLYQVNCTFFDAMGRDDLRYWLARALQVFVPGIPQIYYVGFLAGGNDMERLAETGNGRDVNRHRYDEAEIRAALQRPVVRDLMRLIRFRNSHPAFGGTFRVDESPDHVIVLAWRSGADEATLRVDLSDASFELVDSRGQDRRVVTVPESV